MKSENERLIIEGNTVYEIDLECLKRKETESREKRKTEKNGQSFNQNRFCDNK